VECLADPRAEYPDFDLAQYWEESRARVEARNPFPVVVRADAACADELLDRPLSFLRTHRRADGMVEAEIDLESLSNAVSFVLGFNSHIEVLAPPSVRAAVAATAEAVAARHRP
jgi:predicted DNA-binding transcriptional regulator YafY